MTEKIVISLATVPATEIELIRASFYCPRCGALETWFTEYGEEDNAGSPVICKACSFVFREFAHYPSGNGYTPSRHQEICNKLIEATTQ